MKYAMGFALLFALGLTACAGLNSGLVLYHDFDSPSGNVVLDQGCQENHGAVSGAVHTSLGPCGGAYQFDGVDDDIAVQNHPTLNPTNELTLAAWFKCTGPGIKNGLILLKGGTPHSGYDVGQYALIYFPNNHQGVQGKVAFALRRANDSWWREYYCDAVLATGVWHHVVGTYRSGALDLYVNGEKARVTENLTGPIKIYDGDLYIGADHAFPNNDHFKGSIDEVRVYNRCISADEVRQLYRMCAEVVPCDRPYITQLGFSYDPQGDQDVNVFYTDETFYVRVKDVSLESSPHDRVRVRIKQPGVKKTLWIDLVRGVDGWFTGSVSLAKFKVGLAEVRVMGSFGGVTKLIKEAELTIRAP